MKVKNSNPVVDSALLFLPFVETDTVMLQCIKKLRAFLNMKTFKLISYPFSILIIIMSKKTFLKTNAILNFFLIEVVILQTQTQMK